MINIAPFRMKTLNYGVSITFSYQYENLPGLFINLAKSIRHTDFIFTVKLNPC